MAGATVTARLRHSWPDKLLQVEDLRPRNSCAVLLDWQVVAESVDAGVPAKLARAIAAALVQVGCVAFRWTGECPWPREQATLVKAPRRGPIRTSVDRIAGRWQSDLVVTGSDAVATSLFDYDWELQGQAALVLDAAQNFDERLRFELATRRGWRDFSLGRPARLLLVPAVDGDGALFAAGSASDLQRTVSALGAALDDAGIRLHDDDGA